MTGWIRTIEPDDAEGALRDAYESQRAALGHVTELTQLGSLYPELVATRLALYATVDGTPSSVPEWARRAVALLTSYLNGCLFCTAGHSERLRADGRGELVDAILDDPDRATSGDESVDALLRYTRRLVRQPDAIVATDVDELRVHGWSDLDVLDVNNVAAYYAYINRVASGLGLQGVG